jgi:hypothetical protein
MLSGRGAVACGGASNTSTDGAGAGNRVSTGAGDCNAQAIKPHDAALANPSRSHIDGRDIHDPSRCSTLVMVVIVSVVIPGPGPGPACR